MKSIGRKIRNLIRVIRLTCSPGYAKRISSEYWASQSVSLEDLDAEIRDRYFSNLVSILEPEVGDAILDYGCGAGEKCEYLRNEKFNIIGCDTSEGLMAVARSRGVDCYHVDEVFSDGRKFDRVFLHGVYMYIHPAERRAFLERLGLLLKPKGSLYLLGEPDFEKRRFGEGSQNPLQIMLARLLPVYQFFNASFWTKRSTMMELSRRSGYASCVIRDGPATISEPDRSHFILRRN